jgi:hypothetical protein
MKVESRRKQKEATTTTTTHIREARSDPED